VIIDTSIVVALALREPTVDWVRRTLGAFPRESLHMSWINIGETAMTLRRTNPLASEALEPTLARVGIEPLDLNYPVIRIAAEARVRFPLNFGDCFAYAHARLLNEPLLTLDADFLQTDLKRVLHPDRPAEGP
jgi:ribonuclease VapC